MGVRMVVDHEILVLRVEQRETVCLLAPPLDLFLLLLYPPKQSALAHAEMG